MPLDNIKTIKQVEGKQGFKILKNKVRNNGLRVLFHGSGASVNNICWSLSMVFNI